MASLAVEAILAFNTVQAESFASGLASVVKLSDFVSDFFFIKDLIALERSSASSSNEIASTGGQRHRLLNSDRLQLRQLGIDDDWYSTETGATLDLEEETDNVVTWADDFYNDYSGDDTYFYNTTGSNSDSYERWIPVKTYIFLASLFTAFGVLFDGTMAYTTYQDHKQRKAIEKEQQKPVSEVFWEEGITSGTFWSKVSNNFFESDATQHEENWVWWRHLNVVFEEIPQLILLVLFYIDWSRVYLEGTVDQDYWEQTKASIFVSAIITTVLLIKISIGYTLFRRSKRKLEQKEQQGGLFSWHTSSTNHSDSKDVEKGRRASSKENPNSSFFTVSKSADSSNKEKENAKDKDKHKDKDKDSPSSAFFSSTNKTTDTSDEEGSISAFFSGLKDEQYKPKEKNESQSKPKPKPGKESKDATENISKPKLMKALTSMQNTNADNSNGKENINENQTSTLTCFARTSSSISTSSSKSSKSTKSNKSASRNNQQPRGLRWVQASPEDERGIVTSPPCCGWSPY